ncbi:cyclin-dependent kinase 2-interacting protein isoform X2 [Acanthochromis polyacanthus]|nr:cyclin-dependent kinase 2-interacting protein isoform X2 [Acanthochromis polyacanthus]
MLRWERLNDDGFKAATNIVNLRRSQSDRLLVDESSSSSSSSASQQTAAAAELQDECIKLQEVVDKMVAVVTKMERLVTSQRGIRDLEEFQFGPEGRKIPLFHSWSSKQLEESCHFLFAAYSQELQLKRTILQEVAHTATSDLCLVYLSCWLHQPFIPPHSRLTLEALLLETGHRPL